MITVSVRLFERERPRLRGLAYRMLGSVADAEDVVQDAWLRWSRIEAADIAEPRAWLVRVVTRLCIDRLRAAKARREEYIGPWLPEPVVEEDGMIAAAPSAGLERAEDLTVAFLLALERLSPLERAVFVLHDVFGTDYREVAAMLGKSEAACRQLAVRARGHIEAAKPRYRLSEAEAKRLVSAFIAAIERDDAERLGAMLAAQAVLVSDGGGKALAPLRPLLGREAITSFLLGLARKLAQLGPAETSFARINGQPGMVVRDAAGVTTLALEIDEQGRIAALYAVRNPDKLRHVSMEAGTSH